MFPEHRIIEWMKRNRIRDVEMTHLSGLAGYTLSRIKKWKADKKTGYRSPLARLNAEQFTSVLRAIDELEEVPVTWEWLLDQGDYVDPEVWHHQRHEVVEDRQRWGEFEQMVLRLVHYLVQKEGEQGVIARLVNAPAPQDPREPYRPVKELPDLTHESNRNRTGKSRGA